VMLEDATHWVHHDKSEDVSTLLAAFFGAD
jgi:hypothetical protein